MIIYVATPYSHTDPEVRIKRFEEVNKFSAKLLAAGINCFSPISHSHPIAVSGGAEVSWQFWEQFDKEFLDHCEGMIVYMQDGWDKSVGVNAEVQYAKFNGTPVIYVDPNVEISTDTIKNLLGIA